MVHPGGWLLRFIVGVGLFAGGLALLRRALQALAGPRLLSFVRRWTHTRWHAAAAGFTVTTLLQSSSLANLLIVNLVHARWLALPPAVAFMLGANVGTTTTAQLISIDAGHMLPHVALASIGLGLLGRGRWRWVGAAGGGVVALLSGMGLIGAGLTGLVQGAGAGAAGGWEARLRALLAGGLFPPLLAGTFMTAMVQSSSVTIGIAMALATSGALGLEQGIAFMLGANVGTVGSTILGALAASRPAQQAAAADFLFNVLGVLLVWPFLPFLAALARGLAAEPARQIAMAHTIFNAATAVLGLLCLDGLVGAVRRLLPPPAGGGPLA